ncbi:MAG: hypothetical protein KVP17_004126 [Porospora cf. gigantea B]|uniref:uncharacterized protein n=1 Tax=Porospora cf. gigantea B TaxID=2853592 RepID=UPI00357187C5|nr:MAG: hypothetical protein KVP17_004126 [Porospora cf. gigantea B]
MHHESELVGIVFDCSAVDWCCLEKRDVLPVSPVAAMEGVVIFLRTIIAGWTDKEFVLMAVSGKDSVVVFDGRPAAFDAMDATVKVLNSVVSSTEDSQMATAVSQFLLRFNSRKDSLTSSRLLIVDVSPDSAYAQQTALFNCALTAQKTGAIVDVCSLQLRPNSVMQQLAHLTGGSHLCWPEIIGPYRNTKALQSARPHEAFGEFLIFHCSPSWTLRKQTGDPRWVSASSVTMSNTARCWCHNDPQEMAFVCSSCFAVYCDGSLPSCDVCGATFTLPDMNTVASKLL